MIRKVALDKPLEILLAELKAKRFPSWTWKVREAYGNAFNVWRGGSNMSFFEKIFGKKSSADSAKERLQLVLIHDRTDMTPAELDSLRDDLIATISRHVEIDAQSVQIGVQHDGRSQRLVADIPLKAARHRAKSPRKSK